MKKKLDEANNPEITKDNISLSDEIEYDEDETIKEKDKEIIVCGELNEQILDNIIIKLNNIDNTINNKDLILTKNEEEKENKDSENNSGVNVIKIFSSTLDNISLFDKLMKCIQNENIKKFYFYDNNINGHPFLNYLKIIISYAILICIALL